MLVISNYAKRYPEVYALRNVTAISLAKKLIDLFSRHGVPKEIHSDQGTNFMFDLLQEIHRFMGNEAIRTSPYHPQTNGMVERFNQTFEQMLKKVLLTD